MKEHLSRYTALIAQNPGVTLYTASVCLAYAVADWAGWFTFGWVRGLFFMLGLTAAPGLLAFGFATAFTALVVTVDLFSMLAALVFRHPKR